MKLDVLIRKLLPHDDKFFTLLGESTHNLLMAADLMKQLTGARNQKQQKQLVNEIKDLEHRGDSVTHKIFSELNATFVTPLDREDIHTLASALDDILDHIDGSRENNRLSNLQLLCPNCHAQTPTYRGRNIGSRGYARVPGPGGGMHTHRS